MVMLHIQPGTIIMLHIQPGTIIMLHIQPGTIIMLHIQAGKSEDYHYVTHPVWQVSTESFDLYNMLQLTCLPPFFVN